MRRRYPAALRHALLMSVCMLLPLAAPVSAEAPAMVSASASGPGWAQASSDVAPDPAVRFGSLPNGMRYAILHNETPAKAVSLRMVIRSGSTIERDDEQGLMHFLEHMSFRGSDTIPDGEVVRILQRHGLRFGADTNASTGFDNITYMFDLPSNDAPALDDGLTILREIASKLKIEPALVDAEKGPVTSEERLRDTAQLRMIRALMALNSAGARHTTRFPIGKVDVLNKATAAQLRRLYQANFRPDNATVIVVGNVDPTAIEKDIRARFADWKPVGAPDALDPGKVAPTKTTAELVSEGAPDLLVVSWSRAPDLRPDTRAHEREQTLRMAGITVLNNRLGDLASKPGAPFVFAGLNVTDKIAQDAATTDIQILAGADKWRDALDAAMTEQRQLLRDGMSASELARAVSILKTQLQAQADGAATRETPALAGGLVSAVVDNEVFTSPAQNRDSAIAVLDTATPEEVLAALRPAFSGNGPLLFRSAKAGPVGEVALADALNAAVNKPIAPRVAEASFVWPYADWGTKGTVTSRIVDKALGSTTVHFANGTTLIVKPTSFTKDQVQLRISLGSGRAATPDSLVHALWASDQLASGGTAKASLLQIQRWAEASGKAITISPQQSALAGALVAVTRPADLDSQMQLLTAYARDPGFRPEADEKVISIAPMFANQIKGQAMGVFARGKSSVFAGNDGRYADLPSDAELAATRAGDIKAIWQAQLAAPAEVVMVGDITVDKAIAATAATFAAGPEIKPRAAAKARVAMPIGREEPYVFEHSGRKDQAIYGMYWPLSDYFANPREAEASEVLSRIIGQRLIDTVREKLGLTYSPVTDALASRQVGGLGYVGAWIETPQANFPAFRKIVIDQMADLAARPVTADELLRAKTPIIQSRKVDMEKNPFWTANLALDARLPANREAVLTRISAVEAVTAGDVQKLAARRIAGKMPVTIVVKAKE